MPGCKLSLMTSNVESALSTVHPLSSQVGGHAGVLTTEDGSLIIKPALPLELEFYQSLARDQALAFLQPYTPNFLGTLKLEGQIDGASTAEGAGASVLAVQGSEHKDEFLENLSHPFLKPNILDIKLGTVLYDGSASLEKVARMLESAKKTTSFETGIRLTGFQVYDNVTAQPINTPKSYGKSIKPSQLSEGIARFFPIGSTAVPGLESGGGIPCSTLLPILNAIHDEVKEIRDIYSKLEIRMVGGSLLIVYEGDWARAEEAVERYVAMGMIDSESGGEGKDEEDAEEDSDDEEKKHGPPYVVKLIDFAHTRLAPGEGPDEGVLKGFDTVLRLLEGRIKEVEAEDVN